MQRVFPRHFCGVPQYEYLMSVSTPSAILKWFFKGVSMASFLMWYLGFVGVTGCSVVTAAPTHCCHLRLPVQLWTAQSQPVWATPETHWPTQPLTRWPLTGSLCWPSSSPACWPRPACGSSPSSYWPCSNRWAMPSELLHKFLDPWTFHQSTKCSCVPTESLPDRHQHPAGRPGLLHVPAEVPAAGLLHADDPPCPVPSGRSHGWGECWQLVDGKQ